MPCVFIFQPHFIMITDTNSFYFQQPYPYLLFLVINECFMIILFNSNFLFITISNLTFFHYFVTFLQGTSANTLPTSPLLKTRYIYIYVFFFWIQRGPHSVLAKCISYCFFSPWSQKYREDRNSSHHIYQQIFGNKRIPCVHLLQSDSIMPTDTNGQQYYLYLPNLIIHKCLMFILFSINFLFVIISNLTFCQYFASLFGTFLYNTTANASSTSHKTILPKSIEVNIVFLQNASPIAFPLSWAKKFLRRSKFLYFTY